MVNNRQPPGRALFKVKSRTYLTGQVLVFLNVDAKL
jgi:hypothetical protein